MSDGRCWCGERLGVTHAHAGLESLTTASWQPMSDPYAKAAAADDGVRYEVKCPCGWKSRDWRDEAAAQRRLDEHLEGLLIHQPVIFISYPAHRAPPETEGTRDA